MCLIFKVFYADWCQIVKMSETCVAAEFQSFFHGALSAVTTVHDIAEIDAELHFCFLSMD